MTKLKFSSFLVIVFLILSACQTTEQKQDPYKTADIKSGPSELLEPIEKDIPFKLVNHAKLNSKNDSIAVYFGAFEQDGNTGNWVAIAINDEIMNFKGGVPFNENPEYEKDNDLDLTYNESQYNESQKLFSLRLKELDTLNNKLTYAWLDSGELSDSLVVQHIDQPLKEGNTLPDIALTNLDDEQVDLNDFADEIIVLNWWAIGCAPCREEMPGLNKSVKKYADKKVRFIAITNDSKSDVSKFLEQKPFDYTMTFVLEEDQKLFGNSYPKHLILKEDKTITYYNEGGSKRIWRELDQLLTNQLSDVQNE